MVRYWRASQPSFLSYFGTGTDTATSTGTGVPLNHIPHPIRIPILYWYTIDTAISSGTGAPFNHPYPNFGSPDISIFW